MRITAERLLACGAFGANGIRVNSVTEFENAFKQSLSDPGITIE